MTIEQRLEVLEDIFARLQDYYTSAYSGEEIDARLASAGVPIGITKEYESVQAMNQDFAGTDVARGQFVLILPDSASSPDYGKVYLKGTANWVYAFTLGNLNAIKGPQGPVGKDGPAGPEGKQGKDGAAGPKGDTGPANTLRIGTVTKGEEPSADITGTAPDQTLNLVLPQGDKGADAPVIAGFTIRPEDYHMIVSLSDGSTYDAGYCRGASGSGTGDMEAAVYDPQGKRTDIFQFVADAIAAIPTPDVSGQIQTHNEDAAAHPAIRESIPTKTSQLTNDSGFLTEHQDISGKSDKALSFAVTLTAAGWSGNAQAVSSGNFAASGYAYTVAPASGSFAAYAAAVIYADDVTAAGEMTFHCGEAPAEDLTVNILRTEATV